MRGTLHRRVWCAGLEGEVCLLGDLDDLLHCDVGIPVSQIIVDLRKRAILADYDRL